jgi:hypothetical protein
VNVNVHMAAPQPQIIHVAAPPTTFVTQQDVFVNTSAAAQKHRMLPDSIDESKLTLIHGCFCCNTSCACMEDCCGVVAKGVLCCLEVECCLKLGSPALEQPQDGIACVCMAIRCLQEQTTCIKAQHQCCCLVHSAALPPDDEVPFTIACCGFVCVPQLGCCLTIGDLTRQTIVQTQTVVHQVG